LAPDRILLGTRRGLWRGERRDEGFVAERVEGSDSLFVAVLQAREGGAWIGTPEGLMVYDAASGRIEDSPFRAALPKASISALCEDSRGQLWISYWNRGLVRLDPETGEVLTLNADSSPALPHNQVLGLAVEGDIVWINDAHEGLVRIDVGRRLVQRFPAGEGGIPHGLVRAIQEGPGRDLWFATNFGVARMNRDSGVVTPVAVGRDRSTARVASIVADRADDIWIATTQGLVRIGTDPQNVVWFTEADGLATSQLIWNASAVGESGRLHFGGVGGFVSFDPATVGSGQPPPEVSIVRVTVDGEGASPEGTLTLRPEQRELTLRYAALDFRRPELNRFQFGLEGLDEGWRPVTDAWEVTYMNLDPGRYEFRVRAANGNGIWNDEPATLAIVVLAPWWQTWWGRALLSWLVVLTVFGWNHWRMVRIRRINRDLEARVIGRTSALRKANEELARAAYTDFLTGLPNRRGFEASLLDLSWDGSPACVAIADLDDFKEINDRFGHEVGDIVLREVAARVFSLVRSGDLIARWGGEELVFLFRDSDLASTHEAVERIRMTIAQSTIATPSGPAAITATFGIAEHREGETVDQWLDRADRRLYRGKAAGKNRVVGVHPVGD
jgi:diguanylate cyclase (GGDEF)-like protein